MQATDPGPRGRWTGLEQVVIECAPRGSTGRATGEAEEVLFVLAGTDELSLAGERYPLEFGVRVASPRDPARRGAHVAFAHPNARTLCMGLIERGVIPDFRRPDVVRFGFSPLTTRFADVWDGVDELRALLATVAPPGSG